MIESNLGTFDNSWYKPANPIKRTLWYFVNLLFFKNSYFIFNRPKKIVLKLFGAKLGVGVKLKPSINIKYPWFLEIGDYTWIGEGVWIDNLTQVSIGKNCCISQGALILSGNHDYKKASFDLKLKSIVIENGVWIGAKSIVTQGTRCKSHSVLAVASVASNDLEPYTIYKGNPAVAIRKRIITA